MNRRKMNWALPTALALLFGVSAYCLAAHTASAKSLYQQGQLAENKGDIITAYDDYAQAFQKAPKDLRYKTARERTFSAAGSAHVDRGEKLAAQGNDAGAMTEFVRALEIDPSNELAQQELQALRNKLSTPHTEQETSISPDKTSELDSIAPPVQLKPVSDEPITLHMVQDSKIIYETVGKAAGINVLFDPEYTSKRIQVDLANVSLLDALRILGTVSGTFWHPVTANTIFVALDTRAKRQQLEQQAVQTFYLSNIAQQNDLNDIQTALRNLLANAKLYAVQSQDAIVMRATPDELLLAQKLIEDLDKSRPEVVVDVALLEVNRDRTRTIGLELPGSLGVQLQSPSATTAATSTTTATTTTTGTTQNLTLNNLAHINATDLAVTVGAATANLLLSDTDTKVLQNPSIRATDGQQADIKIGERIPVATGSYQTGAATAIVSSLVNTQFTYLDVGVEVQITPQVHYNGDVTLKIKLVSSQESGSSSIGGITEPIISQRTAEQTVRLKQGETNILGGYLVKQDLLSVAGTPGIGELPILKYIFSSRTHEVQDDELVFMITPRIVRGADITPQDLQELDTGTGANIELRQVSAPAVAPGAPPLVRPNVPPPAQAALPNTALPNTGSPNTASPNARAAGQAAANPQAQGVRMQLAAPPTPFKVGSAFQVSLNLDGGQNVFSIPIQLHYDQTKLSLVNIDSGNYLTRGGQAVTLVHRDSGSGEVAIATSRPPGAPGVGGAGTVCVLTFQATQPGDALINVRRASVENSAQQSTGVDVAGASTTVHIQ